MRYQGLFPALKFFLLVQIFSSAEQKIKQQRRAFARNPLYIDIIFPIPPHIPFAARPLTFAGAAETAGLTGVTAGGEAWDEARGEARG